MERVVGSETLKTLKVVCGLLFIAMIGCLVVAGWFDRKKHTLSGVPTGHFAVNENGRVFYVQRGGPPVDQRPHFPMTAEKYQLWEQNDQLGSTLGACGVLCFFLAVGVVIWVKLASPGSQN